MREQMVVPEELKVADMTPVGPSHASRTQQWVDSTPHQAGTPLQAPNLDTPPYLLTVDGIDSARGTRRGNRRVRTQSGAFEMGVESLQADDFQDDLDNFSTDSPIPPRSAVAHLSGALRESQTHVAQLEQSLVSSERLNRVQSFIIVVLVAAVAFLFKR